MSTNNLEFSKIVLLFTWIQSSKTTKLKRAKFRKFLDFYCSPIDYFSAIRLILPSIDRARGSYGLKEHVLGTYLVEALGMSRDSPDAKKLINWRKGGEKTAGKSAGNFADVAGEILQSRQSSVSGGITVGEVNAILDRLAAGENRNSKIGTVSELIRLTNCGEMKWIIRIIIKELKLGISEKSIFNEFHPDAEDLFNVTCDLRFVCEKLFDRKVRHKRQDIEVGKAVRPQLAFRVTSLGDAWKRLNGKEVIVECKFDGDRIQIHKDFSNVCYFSRNFVSHDEYEAGMSEVIRENVVSERCILDGEMLVWDRGTGRFTEFGANQGAAKLARDGVVGGDLQLCYVVFDVLYVSDSSVIHLSLKERHELLRKLVRPVKGRLEVLLPSDERRSGDPCWSVVVNRVEEVERFFKETVENRDEGIVLKDLGSKWEPGDRSSGKWIKMKPDYVQAGADLDGLIIGGYYGTGRRGGEIAQFLIGIAERPSLNTHPRKFLSFCKVGTGLSDEELDELVTKLKPYFRKYEYPKKSPPSFYQVTNHSNERPDVWVESPEKSFILSVTCDIRTINSDVFAAPYSLRFPRIDRVRYDKPWHECLDVQSLVELVQSSNGTLQRGDGADGAGEGGYKPKRGKTKKGEGRKKLALTVPSHFAFTDVSNVKGESKVFSNMVFLFVNVPADRSYGSLHTLVAENGGTFSMNLNDTVTHCVGAESKGLKFEAAKRRGRDVIHYSWVVDCCSKKQLLPLRPTHFVYLSDASRKKLQEEIDEFSDSYFWDINVTELKQILCEVDKSKDVKIVDYYRKKYCPRDKWCCFHGCRVYFHLLDKFPSPDWEVYLRVSTRRMKVEVSVGGGKVVENPSEATHIVVMSLPGHRPSFDTLLQSFPEDKKRLLRLKRIHVVGSQWLEDCYGMGQQLPEVVFSLKVDTVDESSSDDEKVENDMNTEIPSTSPMQEDVSHMAPLKAPKMADHTREPKRKRGRPVVAKLPPKPKRVRVGKRRATLQEIASDDEISEGERHVQPKAIPELHLVESPRPKRARAAKRPVKLQEIASDDEFSEEDHHVQRKASRKVDLIKPPRPRKARVGKKTAKIQEIPSDDETSEQEHHLQPRVSAELDMGDHVSLESDHEDKSIVQEANTSEKYVPETKTDVVLESKPVSPERNIDYKGKEPKDSIDNDDPVQAMLRSYLPSLGKTAKASNPVVEDKNSPTETREDGSSEVPKGEAVKKKKVSYRDLVKQLLKD